MPTLLEYGSTDVKLTRHQAVALQQSGFVDVRPTAGDLWRVTASSYVGSLVVDDVEFLVRPKISPENLFLLLEPGLPPEAWRQEEFGYTSASDLLPAVIGFFARTVETTLGRGVLRAYEAREEALVAMRGRVDMTAQFKRAGLLTPIACAYDDFTEDVAENRVLRAAIRLCLRVPHVRPEDRQRLMRQLVALESVSDVSVRPDAVDSLHFTRLNQHYEPALGLARLVLGNLTLADARGSTSASSFMVNMNELFQRFVTERLRKVLRGRLEVVDEPTVHLGIDRQVSMQPDLMFREPGSSVRYVGDVKYKLSADARGRSSDYYQLLAYTTAMDLPEGVLIYCRRDGDPDHRTVTVRHAGKRLVIRAVDLSGSPEDVEREIARLAEAIERASRQP